MAQKKVNVTLTGDFLGRFPKVVQRLKDAGLEVEQELEAVGVVSGSVDEAKLANLEKTEGVAAVEPSREVQLPPPESDVQ